MASAKLRLVTKTLLFSTSSSISLLNNEVVKAEQINVISQSKYTNFQHLNIIDKTEDFKEDKKNKEWGKEKDWKLATTEKGTITDFLDDKDRLKTRYKEIDFSNNYEYGSELKKMDQINKMLDKANLTSSVVTYKNVDPATIGFNNPLTEGNQIKNMYP